ncbi:MAG: HAMP domain-containing sensor histidine kinase [Nannocystaceae bacterium]
MAWGFVSRLERGIPPALLEDADLRRRALLAKGIALTIVSFGLVLSIIVYALAVPEYALLGLVNTLLSCGLAGFAITAVRRGRLVFAGNWVAGLVGFGICYSIVSGGGILSPWAMALPVAPVISTVISGRRSGIVWAALFAVFVVVFEGLRMAGVEFPNLNSKTAVDTLATVGMVSVLAITMWIATFSEDLKARAIHQVEEAAEQRDRAVAEEEKARIAAEQAIAANAAKGAFLATMSHELRTPLNAIIGYSELIEEELGDRLGEHVESLRRIRDSGQHLVNLISDILDLARLEASRLELHPERFALSDLLSDLAVTFQPLARKRGNTIIARCDPGVGRIYHDRVRLRQVLINLLGNAIKFTEHGVITISAARRHASTGREWIDLAVIDTGIGIPENKLGSIFESFVQVDSSFARSYEGSGLGLSIVRQLCTMMGGTITAKSALGNGTSIHVRLPIEAPPQAADGGDGSVGGDDERANA